MDEFERYSARTLGAESVARMRQLNEAPNGFQRETWYPDEVFDAQVAFYGEQTGRAAPEILEDFAEAMVPGLLDVYGFVIDPTWTVLDFLANTEKVIHRGVRLYSPQARPPPIKAERITDDEVAITYTSARRLCMVAKGIIRGAGRAYATELELIEERCMLRGDPECYIKVRDRGPAASPPAPD